MKANKKNATFLSLVATLGHLCSCNLDLPFFLFLAPKTLGPQQNACAPKMLKTDIYACRCLFNLLYINKKIQ